jgi:hypothetical protein
MGERQHPGRYRQKRRKFNASGVPYLEREGSYPVNPLNPLTSDKVAVDGKVRAVDGISCLCEEEVD